MIETRVKRKRRFRKRAFNLQKVLFILPNAFTLGSVLCGLYAIAQCITGTTYAHLYQAALAIFVAGFFDSFDGRVARMTKTQSEFGVQMDSLADAISFGVAPAILVYKWALWPLGDWGLGIVFVFTACGVIRLARFNVLAGQGADSRYFIGCPIPLAAAVMVTTIIVHFKEIGTLPVSGRNWVIAEILVLSFLMVTNVRYRTFKDFKAAPSSVALLTLVLSAVVLLGWWTRASVSLLFFLTSYIVWGMISTWFLRAPQNTINFETTPPQLSDASNGSSGAS
jgi:CDP-diacylglycerol---serine O-phosphatidyltransferase